MLDATTFEGSASNAFAVQTSTAPGEVEKSNEAEHVLAHLDQLGPPDADVIRGKHFDGLTFEGIGRALGASPNTVKYWYYRGMDKLRQQLRSLSAERVR